MGIYKDLDVYQRSFRCAISIYQMNSEFPKYLQYDITDDIRRAARSIPSNIAEGYGRNKSNKDIINFLKTTLGSCDEVLFNLEFIYKLNLIKEEKYKKAEEQYKIIGSELYNLIKSLT